MTTAPRRSSAFGWGRCLPQKVFGSVVSRSRFVRSPIVRTSKRPSSGSASGQIFMPPPKQRPFATTTSCIRPPRISSSTESADLRVLPAREDGDRRPEVRDLAAERLRRLRSPAPRSRRSCRRSRRWRSTTRRRCRPRRGRGRGRGRSSRARPSTRDVDRAVELVRNAVRADEVPAGAARDDGDLGLLEVVDPVRDLVDRAVAADDDEQLRAAERGLAARGRRGGRAPRRRACRPRARASPRGARSPASACRWRRWRTPG